MGRSAISCSKNLLEVVIKRKKATSEVVNMPRINLYRLRGARYPRHVGSLQEENGEMHDQ